ncbi:hypothetical protein Golax_000009 [Gossypium laxum]|uniref:Uncharacterized protein n=1 Tax=Gossypium laxum TaxID=34288 RepID=A0A7J9B077_9ROSI|nr:hypothetical protein [Gossypium laxum]
MSDNRFLIGFSPNYSPLKNIVAITRRDDISEEKWMMLLVEILYRCGNFDWVPILGIQGAVGYAPLPVLR